MGNWRSQDSKCKSCSPSAVNPADWRVDTKVTIWRDRQPAFGITAYIQESYAGLSRHSTPDSIKITVWRKLGSNYELGGFLEGFRESRRWLNVFKSWFTRAIA